MKKALAEELFFDGDAMDHEDDLWDDEAGGWDLNDIFGKAKRKASRIARGPREPRAPKAPKKSHMITAYNSDNQARSVHWSPYDRVGVVNAVP
jgi:hypothetical protein